MTRPALQMRNARPREVKKFAQSLTATKQKSWDPNLKAWALTHDDILPLKGPTGVFTGPGWKLGP